MAGRRYPFNGSKIGNTDSERAPLLRIGENFLLGSFRIVRIL